MVTVCYYFIKQRLTACLGQSVACTAFDFVFLALCVGLSLSLELFHSKLQFTNRVKGRGNKTDRSATPLCVSEGKVQKHTSHHYLPGFLL